MTKRRPVRQDPLEPAIEIALRPGEFIDYRAEWDFISKLREIAAQIDQLARTNPERAVRLHESFLAGCYEKADGIDDSNGSFGTFVESLYISWLKARQAAGADPDKTASQLLDRMENDPYGFAYQLEREAVKVLNKNGLAAFERTVRTRFEAKESTEQARHRWGEVLHAIYFQQQDVRAYVALCEQTALAGQDCLAVAAMHKARRKPEEALAWVERGLLLDKKQPYGSMAGHGLAKLKRELLIKLGRQGEALEEAWAEFQESPNRYSYEELMGFVPKAERAIWHTKAMDAAERGDLGPFIELLLETKETERLVRCVQDASDNALEGLSHYVTEPAAQSLAEAHPEVAAKVFRALGMRILKAKKSKFYAAALSHFEDAKHCYGQARMDQQWDAVVAEVRQAHHRKMGFMPGFERLVAGQGPSQEPSFLDRARSRWLPRGS
jgi:tetratricopeptide (TPR) repeat protein